MEKKMRTYEVEFKCTSYRTFIVHADDFDDAENIGWAMLDDCVSNKNAEIELLDVELLVS